MVGIKNRLVERRNEYTYSVSDLRTESNPKWNPNDATPVISSGINISEQRAA